MSLDQILAKVRAGKQITHDDVAGTITTLEELEAYRLGLRGRGALTTDALAAIEARRFVLQRGVG